MIQGILRPTFYEGQILAAGDLTTALQYARGQLARHERCLHSWGIACGLRLSGTEKTDETDRAYVEVTVEPGLAIDGTGREIVVPEPERLHEELFIQYNVRVPDPEAWYPVFLFGLQEERTGERHLAGACDRGQPTRIVEGFDLAIGRPGAELDLQDQPASEVHEGPGSGEWRVLLGFVRWDHNDEGIDRFTQVTDQVGGIGPRYAGVRADDVIARNGRLTLRSRPRSEAGKPAMSIVEEEEGAELRFGLQDAAGAVTPVFRVDAVGNVTAEGTIKGAVTSGTVQVQSGSASHGIVLPLPPGISQQAVDDGAVPLHILVSPRLSESEAPDGSDWGPFVRRCEVDADRRVQCLIRWFKLDDSHEIQDRAGTCDYLIVAAVPPAAQESEQ